MQRNVHSHDGVHDGELDGFVRNRFFHGKLMTARDMAAEQAYHVDRLDTIARHVLGTGIVCGLETTVDTRAEGPDGPTVELTVDRGVAIDDHGRPIVVADDADASFDAGDVPDSIYVYLESEPCLAEPVPRTGSEDACEEECTYNRIREGVSVTYDPAPAPDATRDDDGPEWIGEQSPVRGVQFPRESELDLDLETDGPVPAVGDDELQRIASSYNFDAESESVRSCAGRAEDPRVFLGYFVENDGQWHRQVAGPGEPRPHVYTNEMLYAGLTRHAADFENPHRNSLVARPRSEDGEPLSDGEQRALVSGRTYEQGTQLRLGGSDEFEDLIEEIREGYRLDASEPELELHEVAFEDGEVETDFQRAIDVEDGRATLQTEQLEGRFAVTTPDVDDEELTAIVSLGDGEFTTIDGFDDVEEALFEVKTEAVEPPSDGEPVALTSGESYDQGTQLHVGGEEFRELAQEAEELDDENPELELRSIAYDGDIPYVGELQTTFELQDWAATVETDHLEGEYVVSFDGSRSLVLDSGTVVRIGTSDEDHEEALFVVEPAPPSPEHTGARLRVEHDGSEGGAVDLTSADESVVIEASERADDEHSVVDLSVADLDGEVDAERVDLLAEEVIERSLRRVCSAFGGLDEQLGLDPELVEDVLDAAIADAIDYTEPTAYLEAVYGAENERGLLDYESALQEPIDRSFVSGITPYAMAIEDLESLSQADESPANVLRVAIAQLRVCEVAACLGGQCVRFERFRADRRVAFPLAYQDVVFDHETDASPPPGWFHDPQTDEFEVGLQISAEAELRVDVPNATHLALTVENPEQVEANAVTVDGTEDEMELPEDHEDPYTYSTFTQDGRYDHIRFEGGDASLLEVCYR